jgi:hypothetical protein
MMRRTLYLSLVVVTAACASIRKPESAPASSTPAACRSQDSTAPIYLVDGERVTCTTALSVRSDRIGVVIIQTRR